MLDKRFHVRLNDQHEHVEPNDQHAVHPNDVDVHLNDVDAHQCDVDEHLNVQNVDDDHDGHSDVHDDVDNGRLHS